jgi:DNA-directed RNA polymerase specialized sigma24 family protein
MANPEPIQFPEPDEGTVSEPLSSAELSECINEVNRLTAHQIRALKTYAMFLLSSIRGFFHYLDADDLLHEALLRTFDGRRKWNRSRVDLSATLRAACAVSPVT